jgi:hypothetical protein
MNTQQEMQPAPPQMGQYPHPDNHTDHTILLTSEEEVLLQTQTRQYSAPIDSVPTTSDTNPTTNRPPLMIPLPNAQPPLCIPHIPLRRNINNPQARVAHNYSLVDDLAQSPAAMLVLEVLQTCPTQQSHYFTLGQSTLLILTSSPLILIVGNPISPLWSLSKYRLKFRTSPFTIALLMKVHPHASCPKPYGRNWVPLSSYHQPSLLELMMDDHPLLKGSFKMSPSNSGEKLSSLTLKLSTPHWITTSCLGSSYMYAMKFVASSIFHTMMFPHNGKIVTIDQVSHYEPNPSSNIDNILPFVHTNPKAYPLIKMGPNIFKDPSFLGTYHGAPPLIHPSTQVCAISSNGTTSEDTLSPTKTSISPDIPLVAMLLPQETSGQLFSSSYS